MNPYIEKLNQYMIEKQIKQPAEITDSVLQYLENIYLEEHPVSSAKVREIEEEMSLFYESIPLARSNDLFTKVYDLCSQYERAAFRTGLWIGLRLQQEISQL